MTSSVADLLVTSKQILVLPRNQGKTLEQMDSIFEKETKQGEARK